MAGSLVVQSGRTLWVPITIPPFSLQAAVPGVPVLPGASAYSYVGVLVLSVPNRRRVDDVGQVESYEIIAGDQAQRRQVQKDIQHFSFIQSFSI